LDGSTFIGDGWLAVRSEGEAGGAVPGRGRANGELAPWKEPWRPRMDGEPRVRSSGEPNAKADCWPRMEAERLAAESLDGVPWKERTLLTERREAE
jgi:hypothetical protein